jgi:CBS-domain-containing membrane protein
MTHPDAHLDALIHQPRAASDAEPASVRQTGRWYVGDVMSTRTHAVGEQAHYRQIAEVLRQYQLTAVPVITANRQVIGIVSAADMLRKQECHAHAEKTPGWQVHAKDRTKADARTAAGLMTSPAVTIGLGELLGTAARVMSAHHVKQLPVVTADGRLVGMVSRPDLLKVFLRPDEEIAAEATGVLTGVLLADPAAIRVTARHGVLTLTGRLASFEQIGTAVRLIEAIDGVVSATNKLHAPPPEHWPGAGFHIPASPS